jgi:ferredoxin
MKIIIDRPNCVSCGTCWENCPGLFKENPDDSFSEILEPFRIKGNLAEGMPSQDLEKCAAEAADACPATVIMVER